MDAMMKFSESDRQLPARTYDGMIGTFSVPTRLAWLRHIVSKQQSEPQKSSLRRDPRFQRERFERLERFEPSDWNRAKRMKPNVPAT
jgi:hypothetical protein